MDSLLTVNVTGIDTESIIQELMKIERQPVVLLESKQKIIDDKRSAWDTIKTKLDSLSSTLTPLLSSTTFYAKTVSISDTSVVTVEAGTSANIGTYDIEVVSLAQSQVVQSASFTAPDQSLNISGTVTLNGKSITIASTDTLNSIADKINAIEDIGVNASVLQVEPNDYRLVLTSTSTGTANIMSFEGDMTAWQELGVVDSSNVPNEVRAAQDATFFINGIQFTRSSNEVDDAIEGLTINLLQAKDPVTGQGGKASFSVGFDDDSIVDYVKSFIDEYNAFLDTVSEYNSWDSETMTSGILFGDPLLQRLLQEIRQVIFKEVEGSPEDFRFLGAVGLSTGSGSTFSREGKLSLDEAKLREALQENRDAVAVLFGAKTVNVALASNGSTATATSTYSTDFAPENVINGNTSSALWGSPGGGWMDGTPNDFSQDILEISFGTLRTIDTVKVYTLDSTTYPASSYGIRDFSIEYLDPDTGQWSLISSFSQNTQGMVSASFDALTTEKIRVVVNASNDGTYSRIIEVEAYAKNDGAFNKLSETIQKYTAADGFLDLRESELEAEDESIARQIENLERRLDMRLSALRKQFTALEVMLTKLNTQGMWLSQQLESLTVSI